MKGILDRIEDNDKAVILIEAIKQELIIPTTDLPAGSKVNTWFHIEKRNEKYEIISIDEQTTADEKSKSTALMEKLRAKNKGSKFKRN